MLSTRSILLALLATATLLVQSGCASKEKKPAKEEEKKAAAVPPRPVYVGTITLVNMDDGFVLIDGGLLPSPQPNLELRGFTNGVESSELVSSQIQRRPFVIADIKRGIPQKGDRVFTAVTAGATGTSAAPALPPPALKIPVTHDPAPDFLPDVQLSPGPLEDQ